MNSLNVIIVLFMIFYIKKGQCLGLDVVEGMENNFISSVIVHRSRAFLALSRSVCPNDESTPTLIETHWNTGQVDIFSRFSHKITRHKLLSLQIWGDCNSIQDAVFLSIEPIMPKFWILDKGNDICSPKILSYNLLFNHIVDKTEFVTVDGRNLNVMVIDYFDHEDYGYRAYIGRAEDNVLLVFSLKNMVWWKIKLVETSTPVMPVKADFLSVSKVGPELLYVTGYNELDVFILRLDDLRMMEEPIRTESKDEEALSVNVTFVGRKLGLATGIELDFDSGLIYYMVRDYAILRWNTRYPMIAEYHDVLAQSYESFPYISGFFTDPQNNIWAIVNPANPNECNTLQNSQPIVELPNRTVWLVKYDKYTEKNEIEKFVDDQ